MRRRDARPFALGGLWDVREGAAAPTAREVGAAHAPGVTRAILTTTATPPVDALHDRMPLMIAPESHDAWLDASQGSRGEVMPLARTEPTEPTEPVGEMVAVAVSNFVNDPPRAKGRAASSPSRRRPSSDDRPNFTPRDG